MKRKHARSPGSAETPAPTTAKALERIRLSWPWHFMEAFPEAIAEAEADWSKAVLGHPPKARADLALLEEQRTSLPVMWASFFRPMEDGKTGTELALAWPRLKAPVLRAGLLRIAQARGVYVECLHLSAPDAVAVMRDLFTGEIYQLSEVEQPLRSGIRRWMRFCGVLIDLGTGTWNHISAFSSVSASPELSPEEFLELAQTALSQAGIDPSEIDPSAPQKGLRRFCGIVFPAIHRALRERPAPEPPHIFIVNSDGERLEYQEAQVRFDPSASARLVSALPFATDFVRNGDNHWCWISRQHKKQYEHGENLGDLDGTGPQFTLSANSPERFARLLDRLAALCGERPSVQLLTVMRPWEKMKNAVPAPGAGVKTLMMSTGAPEFEMDLATAQKSMPLFYMRHMRHQLDQEISNLGGSPRSLVGTAEGRAAVEKWLQTAERQGLPEKGDEPCFVDLDPLREELGLKTVADQIVHGPGGRHC